MTVLNSEEVKKIAIEAESECLARQILKLVDGERPETIERAFTLVYCAIKVDFPDAKA